MLLPLKNFNLWSMIRAIQIAIRSYSDSWSLLWLREFRLYRWLPVLLQIVLLSITVFLIVRYSAPLSDALLHLLGFDPTEVEGWVNQIIVWVIRLIAILIYLSIFKYITLIVMAPFLTVLSEKVEERITGRKFDFKLGQAFKDLWRAVKINGYAFLMEILLTAVLLALSLIPVAGWFMPFLILLVQSYFFGFSLLDFNFERWRYSFGQTKYWMNRHRVYVAAHGLVFHFLFLIPVLGWFFAPVWSAIAGTLGFLEWHRDEEPPQLASRAAE